MLQGFAVQCKDIRHRNSLLCQLWQSLEDPLSQIQDQGEQDQCSYVQAAGHCLWLAFGRLLMHAWIVCLSICFQICMYRCTSICHKQPGVAGRDVT